MTKTSKYIGMTLNTWWEVINTHYDKNKHCFFTLKNKANGIVIENVDCRTIRNIVSGKTQVSKLISKRLTKRNITSNQSWW